MAEFEIEVKLLKKGEGARGERLAEFIEKKLGVAPLLEGDHLVVSAKEGGVMPSKGVIRDIVKRFLRVEGVERELRVVSPTLDTLKISFRK